MRTTRETYFSNRNTFSRLWNTATKHQVRHLATRIRGYGRLVSSTKLHVKLFPSACAGSFAYALTTFTESRRRCYADKKRESMSKRENESRKAKEDVAFVHSPSPSPCQHVFALSSRLTRPYSRPCLLERLLRLRQVARESRGKQPTLKKKLCPSLSLSRCLSTCRTRRRLRRRQLAALRRGEATRHQLTELRHTYGSAERHWRRGGELRVLGVIGGHVGDATCRDMRRAGCAYACAAFEDRQVLEIERSSVNRSSRSRSTLISISTYKFISKRWLGHTHI